jgi:hypothetical protein
MSGTVASPTKNRICIAHPWRRRAAHLGYDLNAALAGGTERLDGGGLMRRGQAALITSPVRRREVDARGQVAAADVDLQGDGVPERQWLHMES